MTLKIMVNNNMTKQYIKQLEDLGYSDEKLIKRIIKQNPIEIEKIVNRTEDLIEKLDTDSPLTHKDIVKIGARVSGNCNIQGVLDYYQDLKKLGLSKGQIIKIAGNKGGAKALAAVKDHFNWFIDKNFKPDEIIKIAGNGGGAKALVAVKGHFNWFIDKNFKLDEIIKIAGNDGGAQALAAVKGHFDWFIDNNFKLDEIIKIAGRVSGSNYLKFIVLNYGRLSGAPFNLTLDEIIGTFVSKNESLSKENKKRKRSALNEVSDSSNSDLNHSTLPFRDNLSSINKKAKEVIRTKQLKFTSYKNPIDISQESLMKTMGDLINLSPLNTPNTDCVRLSYSLYENLKEGVSVEGAWKNNENHDFRFYQSQRLEGRASKKPRLGNVLDLLDAGSCPGVLFQDLSGTDCLYKPTECSVKGDVLLPRLNNFGNNLCYLSIGRSGRYKSENLDKIPGHIMLCIKIKEEGRDCWFVLDPQQLRPNPGCPAIFKAEDLAKDNYYGGKSWSDSVTLMEVKGKGIEYYIDVKFECSEDIEEQLNSDSEDVMDITM